jgi:malonyl CoA-acyl carrier protein transacylase
VGLIEAHGTSTRVGDVVEVGSLSTMFGNLGLPAGSIALGSVKSNIGHLKSAAGAAGMLKATLALYHKILPPSANFTRPNPQIDFTHLPFKVQTQAAPWEPKTGQFRRAGVSSFGFGGTNFHVVMEEYVPGLSAQEKTIFAGVELDKAVQPEMSVPVSVASVERAKLSSTLLEGYRGLLFLGAETPANLQKKLAELITRAKAGEAPVSYWPTVEELKQPERIAIEYEDLVEFIKRSEKAVTAFDTNQANTWLALTAQGVYRGRGTPGKLVFMFPGQGSQYVNMLKDLCEVEPIVAATFKEADEVMTPILGKSLTSYIYVEGDEESLKQAEAALRNTEITQPALLTANVALLRLMNKFGYQPEMVIGHSLGEYAALVAAGVLTFSEALQVVSARGREMSKVSMDDNGGMAAVSAPLEDAERILKTVNEYVVLANINSPLQSVIGGSTAGINAAMTAFQAAGFQAVKIPVSHAFHTKIVAPTSQPLRAVIAGMDVKSPQILIAANVTGERYPTSREEILDILAAQVASPVQFIKGMTTLFDNGGRVFVEVGPKRVLNALGTDIFKGRGEVMLLATNHPRKGSVTSFKEALCGLLAAGVIGSKNDTGGQNIAATERVVGAAAIQIPKDDTRTGQAQLAEAKWDIRFEDIKQFVLGLVSEKTGYPAEMLDLDLDLEADLGVDTVKQAEIFLAVRTRYGIPRREDLRLSDYNTLVKVIEFVQSSSGAQAIPEQPGLQPAVAEVAEPQNTSVSTDDVKAFVLGLVSEKTGYPVEMLDLDLDLEADLGVDTVKQAELFLAVRTEYGIPRREDLRLSDYNTLAKVIQFVQDAPGGLDKDSSTSAAPEKEAEIQTAADLAQKVETMETVPVVAGEKEDATVKAFVLDLVSEKTGYPVEMLDLDLDLEADLGIDTVKQAELFLAVRTQYGIPRREDLRLSDYNTLAKVIGFVHDALADQPDEPAAGNDSHQEQPATAEEARPLEVDVESSLVRRVPVPVLRPRMEFCQSTGVILGKGSRVLIVADQGKTSDSLVLLLRGHKVQVKVVSPDAAADEAARWQVEGNIQGVYFLVGLDVATPLDEIDPKSWHEVLQTRVYLLAELMKVIPGTEGSAEGIDKPAKPFLLSATRMGGLFGYGLGLDDYAGGAISGFTKALAWERVDNLVKVVDFSSAMDEAEMAACLLEETLSDPGAVEIGRFEDRRFTISLADQVVENAVPQESANLEEFQQAVFLISGGTGGIIAPIVEDLAHRTKGVFYLLGRSVLPLPNDPDLLLLQNPGQLKTEWMRRLTDAGEKPTPRQVDKKLETYTRGAATLKVMETIRNLGGEAEYLVCDVTQSEAVEGAAAEVLARHGKVDVLIHAAGMDHSQRLQNKPIEEFRQVVSVKADGFFNLYRTFQQRKQLPRAIIGFSSLSGRFGNLGQTDYSAANDLLCKLLCAVNQRHPEVKTIALDWGAWAEVGMASRGHIPELMQRAGIEMMKPSQAAPWVAMELQRGIKGGEILLHAGSPGMFFARRSEDMGLDVAKTDDAVRDGHSQPIMFSHVTGMDPFEGIILETELDPKEQVFLRDHALNGIPLLPGVMGIQGFMEAAQYISSTIGGGKGDYSVSWMDDIQFLTPLKFYRDEPRKITWKVQVCFENGETVAHIQLESIPSAGYSKNESLIHFKGSVHLLPSARERVSRKTSPPRWNGSGIVSSEDIYRLFFHGPAFRILDGAQRSGEKILGRLAKSNDPLLQGEGVAYVPVLVELCMQTAGLWEAGSTGVLALPRSIGSIRIHNTHHSELPVYAVVHPKKKADGQVSFDADVVDAEGEVYLEISDYCTSPLSYSVEEELLAPIQKMIKK